MFPVGHAVKLKHGDSTSACLVHRPLEVVERPVRPGIARRWNQKRMVHAGLESESASPFVRVFGRAAAPGETDAQPPQNRKRVGVYCIARISETDRARNALLEAPRADGLDLLRQLVEVASIDGQVVACVIADLEPVAVQFGDLRPGHVILFVRGKGKAFRDEKSGRESVFLQHWTDNGIMRRH